MASHHEQIVTAANEHRWTVRECDPAWVELRRGAFDLSLAFRSDGQLSTGSRDDRSATPGQRFAGHIGKSTKNRLAVVLAWITEEPAAIDLDTDSETENTDG